MCVRVCMCFCIRVRGVHMCERVCICLHMCGRVCAARVIRTCQ
jgi:hypothetical protein